MSSWLVWTVFAVAFVLLGFVGYHFSVRTLRFTAGGFAAAVVVVVTLYGVKYPAGKPTPADLVHSFTRGFNELSMAFLIHAVPAPGQAGWLAIIAVLVFAYRELEVWAMRWEPPAIDTSALSRDKQGPQSGGAPGQPDMTLEQLHESLVAELRFRLPAVAVRSPAVLPGGTKRTELASIVENSGVTGSGLAGAVIRFFEMLWPSPRRRQVRVWIEHDSRFARNAPAMRVTVDLEDPHAGGSVATKTLVAGDVDEAAEVIAGYVARHLFTEDPTAPPWCVGSFDGDDLAAMLTAGQQRVFPGSPDDVQLSRQTQIGIFERCKLDAGVARYELASLYDLAGDHVKALRLHAINRMDYPRFWRGRYRLGMSLEMIASPTFELFDEESADTFDCLWVLDRCGVTTGAWDVYRHIMGEELSDEVREERTGELKNALLTAAHKELRAVRRQVTLGQVVTVMFVHRDERAIRKPYWRLRVRQGFHDGARVAELLAIVRQRLNERELGRQPSRIGYQARRAVWITAAITGDNTAIKAIFDPAAARSSGPEPPRGPIAGRTRWLPWQCRTPSWQAAYNTACLYAALEQSETGSMAKEELARHAVASLRRVVCDRDCEMERPYDWISNDPDFSCLRSSDAFTEFLAQQRARDYPAERTTCVFCRRTDADILITSELAFPGWIQGALPGPGPGPVIRCERGIPRARQAGQIRTWAATGAPSHIQRAVCVPCSTSWMASVEGAVRPALESMISGYGIGLTAEAQLAVAAWAAMRAAMFEYLWTDDPVLTAADRATIMSRDRLPSGFRARMALAASPGWPLQALGHVSELRGPRGRALCLTITAGRLVVQVFGGPGADAHHLRAADQPEAGWIGISSPRAPVVWPLESALDDLGACLPWRPSPAGMLGSQ